MNFNLSILIIFVNVPSVKNTAESNIIQWLFVFSLTSSNFKLEASTYSDNYPLNNLTIITYYYHNYFIIKGINENAW